MEAEVSSILSTGSVLNRLLKLSVNPDLIDKNEDGPNKYFVEGFKNGELTPGELAHLVDRGMAFCVQLAGPRKKGNFFCSDIAYVDIDGEFRLDDVPTNDFLQKHLTILYTTASHTELDHRFRLVFALERTITTAIEMASLFRALALRLSGDMRATDATRISFGSRGCKPSVFDRQLDRQTIDDLIEQGRSAGQSDSARHTRQASTVSRKTISLDQPVRIATGDILPFSELKPRTQVHCPFHYDTRPSAHIAATKSGKTCLCCSTCQQTFHQPNDRLAPYDFFAFDKTLRNASDYFGEHRDYGPFFDTLGVHPGLDALSIHRTQDKYLKISQLPKGVTLIKSPKGTGKTQLMEDLLRGDDSTLLIGHRRSLIRQICTRLDLRCYLDYTEGGRINQRRLGICLDSLERLEGTGEISHSTVVLDESEQVLSHFLAGTLTKHESARPRSLYLLFELILRRAKRIIALDADLGFLTFETLRRIAHSTEGKSLPISIFVNDYKAERTIEIFQSDAHLVADLRETLLNGGRAFVASNSKRRVHALRKAMLHANVVDDPSVIAITSETTGNDSVQAFMRAPAKECLQYQLILASPSMGTGVDLSFPSEAQEIDAVYGFCEPLITTHFDFDQHISRVRNPKRTKVWITPRQFEFDTSIEVIRSDLHKYGVFKSLLTGYDDNLERIYSERTNFEELASLVVSQQRASKNTLQKSFLDYKISQGFKTIEVPEDKDAKKDGGGLYIIGRELAEAERTEKLLSAVTLPKDEYDRLDRLLNLC